MPAKHCKDCGQPIKWVKTINGAWLALMISPDADGTYRLKKSFDLEAGVREVRAYPLTRAEQKQARADGELLWLPHVASCTAIPRGDVKGCPPHIKEQLLRRKRRK
ncbi:hypothetical protein CKALI_11390 [Corynebacterium kalinowskii]|uniref:Uncharacterized protein n=1 Tax=Corynebacterium kalinowskii TaxID=2675216 RepID=A0A6B8VD41_9CORY|nr:hypothetical protein [Corynebacterium kalinowskii]QGU03122.1 hypothetical protein CKALI_11390 [Corynebacterium kalinowskii]